ncbi:hypothetical protein HN51_062756 [Arachis hypogaea]
MDLNFSVAYDRAVIMFRGIDVDINFNSCLSSESRASVSHEEKRSAYAPQFGVRYDEVYRIEKCWRKKGIQSLLASCVARKRRSEGGRTLRAQKNVMKCPSCSIDIAEFLQNPEVNRHMMSAIETLLREAEIEESSEVSNDKNNENIETVNNDDGTEVSKHCDSGENVLEEIKDNDLNQPHKRRKGTGDSAIVNSEEQIDVAID